MEPKFHSRGHKIPSVVPILSQKHPVNNFLPCFPKIHSNYYLPMYVQFFRVVFPFRFSNQNTVRSSHLSNACCIPRPSHPPWLEHPNKLRSSSLCTLLQSPVTSSFLGPNVLLYALFSNTVYVLPLVWEIKFHTHTKQQVKLWFLYFTL